MLPLVAYLRARGGGPPESPFKRRVGVALRVLAVASLIIALVGPLKDEYSPYTDIVFALDVSESVERDTAAGALEFIRRAFADKPPEARMGLVVFGADGAVEVLVRSGAEAPEAITAQISRGGTDIGRALEVAMGALPPDGQRRVVLMSDGLENLGSAHAAATAARAIGVEIFTIGLDKRAGSDEVSVQGISAPSWVSMHEPYEVSATVLSARAGPAHLAILRNGALVRELTLELQPGENVVPLIEQADAAGLYEYEVVLNSEHDDVPENNRYQTFVQVRGAPRILHVVDDSGWGRPLSEALRAQGLTVDEVPAVAVPSTLHELTDYELVVLDNVSGFDLSFAKMELLEEYVRDAGGGVIKLGGERSFSAGGYYGTPVERLLPVAMDVKTEVKIPTLSMLVVIDKSGSMASRAQGESKLEIAKAAAFAAVEVLNPLDRVGVLAFDSKTDWAVPLTEASDRRSIATQLGELGAGGGTDLQGALEEAHRVMAAQTSKVKHLIVLSDGLTDSGGGFGVLCERVSADAITMSTVALGADADRELLEYLATCGKGRHYYTDDPNNIPHIFTTETVVVSRGLIVEERTRPALTYPGEMLQGFDAGSFPPLDGYQLTFPKPAAQVLLTARGEDPLLVAWRYGLGKSVAFASDLAGRWGKDWVGWPEYGRFVAQMARWTMRRKTAESLLPRFRWVGSRGEITVDALDRDDRFINRLALEASVVDPDKNTSRFMLEQIAPGRYRAAFDVPRIGRYYVSLSGSAGEVTVGPMTVGLAVPYSAEYAEHSADHDLLRDLATSTGGQFATLDAASMEAISAVESRAVAHRWRIWWPFLAAALVLMLLEIAVRKVVPPESWRERWRAFAEPRREAASAEPGYEALRRRIAKTREAHIAALDQGPHVLSVDPAARARLYLARLGRRDAG